MLPDGEIMSRQFQIGPNVSQRLQNKAPLMHSRMRHDERRIAADKVTGKEQIEIEGARRILFPGRRPTERLLDCGEMRVQFWWRAFRLDLDDRIEKRLRPRHAIHRLRLINATAGDKPTIRHAMHQQLDPATQIGRSITEVRAESDAEEKVGGG